MCLQPDFPTLSELCSSLQMKDEGMPASEGLHLVAGALAAKTPIAGFEHARQTDLTESSKTTIKAHIPDNTLECGRFLAGLGEAGLWHRHSCLRTPRTNQLFFVHGLAS